MFLVVGLGAAGWWLWDLYWNRADLSYWQLVVAVVSAVPSMVTLVKDSRVTRVPGEDDRSERDRLADRLADAVQEQWDQAATARRLQQAEAIAVRWTQSATPVAGSASDVTDSTRFPLIPGFAETRQEQLRSGRLRDPHTVYAGLRSGRLVIVGPPGAGKSGAAVLLVLAALHHRREVSEADRAKVLVPVLFTLHDWNPSTQHVEDWLISQLRQTYDGLFTGKRGARAAAALLRTDKITVILDGLDEINEQLRPLALQSLNDQAVFRLVVLSRTTEIAHAAEQTILEGAVAVELQDVGPDDAANYLTRVQLHPPPRRWQELTDQLHTSSPNDPIAQALNNPLTITLVRDTYRAGDTVGELLDFCASTDRTREDIVDHLLDRVLRTAYTSTTAYTPRHGDPPQPRYTLPTAQHTLRLIAARMSQDHTQDLAWWRIPSWTPTLPRALTIGLVSGLAGTLGLRSWLPEDPSLGIIGPVEGLVIGFGGMLGAWLASKKPSSTAPARWHVVFSNPLLVFIIGMVFGYITTAEYLILLNNWLGFKHLVWLVKGLVVWLVVWFLVGLAIWLSGKTRHRTAVIRWRTAHNHPSLVFVAGLGAGFVGHVATGVFLGEPWGLLGLGLVGLLALGLSLGLGGLGRDSASPLTPLSSWSQDRAATLGIWLVLALLLGGFQGSLVFGSEKMLGLTSGHYPEFEIPIGLALWLISGLTLGLIYPETWSTSLACTQLTIRRRTPIQLMRFLADAHERNVLRTVGPVYQFRHARLQDRLAEQHITAPTTTRAGTMPDPPVPPTPSTPPAS
ncbi:MAG: hypothetical protein ACRDRI_18595 [Pseudonocardiaceae bacterium]